MVPSPTRRLRATARWLSPRAHFCRRISRICRMDSRSVAIAPLSSAGADDALDHPASLPQAPAPGFRAGSPALRSRSAIYVFTIPILAFTMADLGVHDAPIPAFTMDRSKRSRSAGTRTAGIPRFLGVLVFEHGELHE